MDASEKAWVPDELIRGLDVAAGPETAASRSCPVAALRERLRAAGMRPTRQRMLIGWLLFARGDRHVCAEDLFMETQQARAHLSLATVYNTLNQFSETGLLRKVATVGERAVFDTNTGDHHHFFVENDGTVLDVCDGDLELKSPPTPPAGYRVVGVDVVVRLARIEGTA